VRRLFQRQPPFHIQSADGNYRLRIGADLQVDDRTFTGPGAALGADTILLRRVRPTFSGTVYKYVDYFLPAGLRSGIDIIYDAYLELKYFSRAKVRVGKLSRPKDWSGCRATTTPASSNAACPRCSSRAATSDTKFPRHRESARELCGRRVQRSSRQQLER